MTLLIRPATVHDDVVAAHLIFLSGEPIFRYLFFEDPDSCEALIRRFFREDNNVFTYRNAFLAVNAADDVAGLIYLVDFDTQNSNERAMTFAFPKHYGIIRTAWRFPRFLKFAQFTSIADPLEYFINHLAVHEQFRGQGVALQLLQFAEQQAIRQHLPYLGLYVDIDNDRARSIYETFGFQIIQTISVDIKTEQTSMHGQYRMRKYLDRPVHQTFDSIRKT